MQMWRLNKITHPGLPCASLPLSRPRKISIRWTESTTFKAVNMPLFGDGSPESWTVSIMSDLKDKSHEIQPGRLRWIMRTALPLRPDFNIWLNGEKLEPSKASKGLLKKWIIGKDLVNFPHQN